MKFFVGMVLFCGTLFAQILIPQTFEANFIQYVTNEENQTLHYSGNVKATIEKKALWHYLEPVQKSIYYKDKELLIIEDELEQAIYTQTSESIDFFDILQNATRLHQNSYKAQCCDNSYTIVLSQNKVSAITYSDKIGNTIKIVFSNVLYDTLIDDQIFTPNIPKEYDLIRR